MRVILLTHYFPPEVGAPQARLDSLAHGLSERGVEVTVHSGPPHYPDGRVLPPYRNRPWSVEWRDGVRVVRSAVLPSPNKGVVRRLADHASFALSAVATARLAGRADAIVVESPPLFLAGAGVPYARQNGAALILNIADLWPQSAVDLGAIPPDGRAVRAARRLEAFAYRGAAAITAPTEGIVSALESRPECEGKVRRIAPFVDAGRFQLPRVQRSDGPLRVLYAGTVGLAQGMDALVEAAALAGPEIVDVVIAGSGAEAAELRARIRADNLQNVSMLGTVPSEAVPELYAAADVATVLLRDRPVLHGALPTKTLEAMAAGRPLVLSGAGEAARFVERAGCGIVVAPEDPAQLADALRRLAAMPEKQLREMGDAGRRAVADFSLSEALDSWGAVLEEVAGR